jgi:hypothetical protein
LQDFEALTDENNVVSTLTARGGVSGRSFVDEKTKKSIFLPAAGYRGVYIGELYHVGYEGCYWSDTPASAATYSYYLHFYAKNITFDTSTSRGFGLAVRCVRK